MAARRISGGAAAVLKGFTEMDSFTSSPFLRLWRAAVGLERGEVAVLLLQLLKCTGCCLLRLRLRLWQGGRRLCCRRRRSGGDGDWLRLRLLRDDDGLVLRQDRRSCRPTRSAGGASAVLPTGRAVLLTWKNRLW